MMPTLQQLRQEYIFGTVLDTIFTNPKTRDDPAVQTLLAEVKDGRIYRLNLELGPEEMSKQILAFRDKELLRDSDIINLLLREPKESPLRAASQLVVNTIEARQDEEEKKKAEAKATYNKKPNPKPIILKQFEEAKTGLVMDLNKATTDNFVKSYARGQGVAIWESSQGKERIELGGADPDRSAKFILESLQPIFKYNAELGEQLTARIGDQLQTGLAPETVAANLKGTIIDLMKTPIGIPLKNKDGSPKLDKDGNQAMRFFSPETYANMLSRTTTYTLRNRGYIDHYEKLGIYDGWISVCAEDERSCEVCIDKDGKLFAFDDEMPAYHPFCRCRPKSHLKPEAEYNPDEVAAPATPLAFEKGITQAYQDWTVDSNFNSIKDSLQRELIQIRESGAPNGADYGVTKEEAWINKALPEASKGHATVGAYGYKKAIEAETPWKFLGCSQEVYGNLEGQVDDLFKQVNVARMTSAKVNLPGIGRDVRDAWDNIVASGKYSEGAKIEKRLRDSYTEIQIGKKVREANVPGLMDIINKQKMSNSFLSEPIDLGVEKKSVPFTEFKQTMQQWRILQKKPIDEELFNDAIDMAMRDWFNHADNYKWASRLNDGNVNKMATALEGMHINPGIVKETAPDVYEYLTKQIVTGQYGEDIKSILAFSGDLKKNIPAEIKVFNDWDQMRNIIQGESGLTITFRPKEDMAGKVADIIWKEKKIAIDRSLSTEEARRILPGQYARFWAEDKAKELGFKGDKAPIQTFFNVEKKLNPDVYTTELAKLQAAVPEATPSEQLGNFINALYADEKKVRDIAPKSYDRFVALNQKNYYGRGIGTIFDTSATKPLQDLIPLVAPNGQFNYELAPMKDYQSMVKEVQKIFPFKHQSMKGANGRFNYYPGKGDVKSTVIQMQSKLKETEQGKATLVHETGHGIDWLNSAKHKCSNTIDDLKANCFPNLPKEKVDELFRTELKNTMMQVRHSMEMGDTRLAGSLNEPVKATVLEDPSTAKRIMKAPPQVDYAKAKADFLNEIDASMKHFKAESIDSFKQKMETKAKEYAGSIADFRQKDAFLYDFMNIPLKGTTTLYRTNYPVPVTIYNFDDFAERYFTMPIKEDVKQGIKQAVKLSWMQRVESHSWSGDLTWSLNPTERWACFVESLWIDSKRTSEIAPQAYKAFMEGLKNNKYSSVMGKLLGFRRVV